MPDKSSTDIVMRFTYGDKGPNAQGSPVLGECALAVDPKDKFMKGFESADYDSYSNFFEVLKFSFNFSAAEDSDKEDDSSSSFQTNRSALAAKFGATVLPKNPNQIGALSGQFAKWRSMGDSLYKDKKFGVDIESFSFSRYIDRASPDFFMYCAKSFTFDTAALVKRVSVGVSQDGNSIPQGYLRLDFKNVMLKSVKWSDGDVVVEDCEMVFELFKVQYKRQSASGALDTQSYTTMASWDREFHTDPNRNKIPGKKPRAI